MDFRFSAEDEGFRGEVEAFLDAEMPRDWMARVSGTGVGAGGDIPEKEWEFSRSFQKKLAEKGWLTLSWPREHGGLGVGYVRQALFAETLARRRAPYYNQGVDRVGPTIHALWVGGAAGALPAADPVGHRVLLPGVQRDGGGVGPGGGCGRGRSGMATTT